MRLVLLYILIVITNTIIGVVSTAAVMGQPTNELKLKKLIQFIDDSLFVNHILFNF